MTEPEIKPNYVRRESSLGSLDSYQWQTGTQEIVESGGEAEMKNAKHLRRKNLK